MSLLTHNNLGNELVRLITLISTYAQISAISGFDDNYKALEEFVREFYEITNGYKLINTNALQNNYKAIDLIDDTNKVAVQVTNTANAPKIKNTLDQWKKLNKANYKLIIVGVVKANRPRTNNVTVIHISNLVREAATLPITKLEQLLDAFRKHIPPQTYSLTTDQLCVSNIIDYLDRGAINHMHDVEGDYTKMYESLQRLNQYIISGSDSDYPVTIKILSQYSEQVKKILTAIKKEISLINAICDRSRNMAGVIQLGNNEHQEIDTRKFAIRSQIQYLRDWLAQNQSS